MKLTHWAKIRYNFNSCNRGETCSQARTCHQQLFLRVFITQCFQSCVDLTSNREKRQIKPLMYKTFSTIFILNLLIGEIFKPVRYIYSSSKNNYYFVSKSTVASYCHNLRKFVFDICDILKWLCLRTEFAVPLCPLLFVTMRDQAILVYVLRDVFFVFYSS